MKIKESELAVLNLLFKNRAMASTEIVGALDFSKPHVHGLLNDLEAANLLEATLGDPPKKGPTPRIYKVTSLGNRVRVAANKLADELAKAGRKLDSPRPFAFT